MIKKIRHLIVLVLAFGPLIIIANGAPPDRDLKIAKIEQFAQAYKIDGKEAAAKFKALYEPDSKKAREAAAYFEQAKAYEIAALALPEIKDQGVRSSLRQIIIQKKNFSPAVCQAALGELGLLNAEDLGLADGEHIAAVANAKEELSEAIARWLAVAAPKLPHNPNESAVGYAAFIAESKLRAAKITVSSAD